MNIVGTVLTEVEVRELEITVRTFNVKMRFSLLGKKAYRQNKRRSKKCK